MVPSSKTPEGARAPAPGELELVRQFVNTVDLEDDDDRLADPASAARWLARHGLLPRDASLDRADLERLLRVREAIRDLARARHADVSEELAVRTLNKAADRSRFTVRFRGKDRAALVTQSSGVDGAIARILAIVCTSMAEDSWSRLKACRRESCRWLFYDHTKNRSSRWCHMSICGNREKARTYRRRHRKSAES